MMYIVCSQVYFFQSVKLLTQKYNRLRYGLIYLYQNDPLIFNYSKQMFKFLKSQHFSLSVPKG